MNSNIFNLNIEKSFFSQKNFYGKYSPISLNNNMISCNDLIQFHYDVSFILNLIASLYIEIKKKEVEYEYNIIKFGNLINNLNIQINSNNDPTNLSSLTDTTFIFYYKKFESKRINQDDLYSSISENQKPYFSSYANTLIPENKIDNYGINFNNNYNKANIVFYKNECKFKEILTEIFKQTPENILGFLLYNRIYYNIILFNIRIQNSIRINYLNNIELNYNNINISNENLQDIKISINRCNEDLIELNRRTFINIKNEYLLEKNNYRKKINAINTIKDDFAKSQDKFNKSLRNYNRNINNYDTINKYSKYVIYFLLFVIVLLILIIYYGKTTNNDVLLILIIILMIILIYLYYKKFKYVINENFTGDNISKIKLLNVNYNIEDIITDVIIEPNCFFKLLEKDFLDEDKKRELNNNIIKFEIKHNFIYQTKIKSYLYLTFAKSFLGNNFKILPHKFNVLPFLNEWRNIDSNVKQYLIGYNTNIEEIFTHYTELSIPDTYSDTIYTINPTLYRGKDPIYIYFNLTFNGGTGFQDILIREPIFLLKLFRLRYSYEKVDYKYKPAKIIILNGGYGYKSLPTQILLNNNYFIRKTNPINFNFIIDKLKIYNSYNFVKKEINNVGVYLNNLNSDIIPSTYNPELSLNNKIISSNCIPRLSYILNEQYYNFNFNYLTDKINKIKEVINKFNERELIIQSDYLKRIDDGMYKLNCIYKKLSETCRTSTTKYVNEIFTLQNENLVKLNKEVIRGIKIEINNYLTYINNNIIGNNNINTIINSLYENIKDTNNINLNIYKTELYKLKTYINNIKEQSLNTDLIPEYEKTNNDSFVDLPVLTEITNTLNRLADNFYPIKIRIEIFLLIKDKILIINEIINTTIQILNDADDAKTIVGNLEKYYKYGSKSVFNDCSFILFIYVFNLYK